MKLRRHLLFIILLSLIGCDKAVKPAYDSGRLISCLSKADAEQK